MTIGDIIIKAYNGRSRRQVVEEMLNDPKVVPSKTEALIIRLMKQHGHIINVNAKKHCKAHYVLADGAII